MKILVTGGAGFIGFHTAKALLKRNDKVIIVDNFNKYYDSNLKKNRIKELKKLKKPLKVIKADISNYKALEAVFKKNKFDKICHLAAQAGVRYSLENPFTYIQSNTVGFVNLLELCRKYKIKDFVFASSSSVYGNNKKTPFSEKDRVDTPISLYAATKKNNEEIAHCYSHLFGINCIGLRFFTVIGEFGRPDMAYFKFTDKILKGKQIELFNPKNNKRDYTYVSDIVNGVVKAIDSSFKFEIFNLGNSSPVDLYTFLEVLERKLGIKAKVKEIGKQAGDVDITYADISKAKKLLGYQPKTSVKEGVKNFIEWYRGYYENPNP